MSQYLGRAMYSRPRKHKSWHWLLAAGWLTCHAAWADTAAVDLTTLPLEQLLNLEVSTVSRFNQKLSNAPASITVITAEEIQQYGYRTVADALRSVPGFYITNDRNYDYIGVRGFSRAGDYNSRLLMLVDGYRLNDGVYDQASVGNEFPINMDLIERIEVISGPGSAVYGNNALLGVINVITKRSKHLYGAKIKAEVARYDSREASATYGRELDNGMELVFGVSKYRSDGADIYFAPYDDPATHGMAYGLDFENSKKLFAKLTLDRFSVEGTLSERNKGIPTASFQQVFGAPGSYTYDAYSILSMQYGKALSGTLDLTTRIYYGEYEYQGDYVYPAVNRDKTLSQSWGGEAHLLNTAKQDHKMLVGVDYRNDQKLNQSNFNVDPYLAILDDHRSNQSLGVFAQDDYFLSDRTTINFGLRYDYSRLGGSSSNPRIGMVYQIDPGITTLKFLYGSAFRAPNAFERFYATTVANYIATGTLQPERIKTYEFIAEHRLNTNVKLGTSLFNYDMRDLITLASNDMGQVFFENRSADISGVELTAEQLLDSGARWRSSYSWQQALDHQTYAQLANSPRSLYKLNYALPLFQETWNAGVELQYMSNRQTVRGVDTGSVVLANLSLVSRHLSPNLEAAFFIKNIFNRQYADPATFDHVDIGGRQLDFIPQDGRVLRAGLTYSF